MAIEVDHNKTRVAARWKLVVSLLRMKMPVNTYAGRHPDCDAVQWTAQQWQELREVEGVLYLTKKIAIAVQFEQRFLAGYVGPLRMDLLRDLRSNQRTPRCTSPLRACCLSSSIIICTCPSLPSARSEAHRSRQRAAEAAQSPACQFPCRAAQPPWQGVPRTRDPRGGAPLLWQHR